MTPTKRDTIIEAMARALAGATWQGSEVGAATNALDAALACGLGEPDEQMTVISRSLTAGLAEALRDAEEIADWSRRKGARWFKATDLLKIRKALARYDASTRWFKATDLLKIRKAIARYDASLPTAEEVKGILREKP
jgi:hypothetical protein